MKKRTVGILGMSGNPMHDGHARAGLHALHELGLDEVWFMITPHSPHKDPASYIALEHRMHLAHLALMSTGRLGNKLKVSDFEAALLRYGEENSTANMLERFSEVYDTLQPVWLMGADNLLSLPTWGRWTEIMERYPVAVLARGNSELPSNALAVKQYREQYREQSVFRCQPGTWTFISGFSNTASSTEVREKLQAGVSPSELCADAEAYIRQYDLYQTQ